MYTNDLRSKDYRLKARQALSGNWGPSMAVCLVASLLGGAITGSGVSTVIMQRYFSQLTLETLIPLLIQILIITFPLSLIQLILGGPIRLGLCRFLLNQQDGNRASFSDLFSQFRRFGSGLCLYLLTGLFVCLWSLLLIVPGIVANLRYAMAPFIMAENPDCTALDAIRQSKRMMQGHKWQLFCLQWSFLGWSLLSALTFGIGELFLNPYMSTAYSAFYRNISLQNAPE